MPIEIKELVIRATVEQSGADKKAGGRESGKDRSELVAECVEQVLEILRKRGER